MIFWDPKSVNFLNSAQPYLDDLRRVRILHDTSESAAKLVNEIYEDPMAWWSSPEVQEVRANSAISLLVPVMNGFLNRKRNC